MPDMNGIEALSKIKAVNPLAEAVILTEYRNIDSAKQCIRLGAFEYLIKPCDIDHIVITGHNAYEKKLKREHKIRDREVWQILAAYG